MKRRQFGRLLAGVTASSVWPSFLHAQKAMPVVGFLNAGHPAAAASYVAAFRQGLAQMGYVEGQNLKMEYGWAEGRYDRLPSMAAEFVSRKVDVIATSGGPHSALAAKLATSVIPIVFNGGDDPVVDGLVASLARPGGNVTGITLSAAELNPKRLELLRELVPGVELVALLVNPNNTNAERVIQDVQHAAGAKGVRLVILRAGTSNEIDEALASLSQRPVGALMVQTDTLFNNRREQLVALAAHHAVPAIYPFREFVVAGGLISYATSLTAVYRQAGVYTGRIMKGAKPADLPVLRPSTFELVINTKTAKALGLVLSPSFLARADELIE